MDDSHNRAIDHRESADAEPEGSQQAPGGRLRSRRRRQAPVPEAATVPSASQTPTKRLHRVRITKLAVLINTNKPYNGGWIVEELRRYLETSLFTKSGMYAVIRVESGKPRRHVLAVEVQAPSIEIGERQSFVHAHFILRIKHISRVVLGEMAPAIKRHVQLNTIFASPFVSVRLLDGTADNYVLKEVEAESVSESSSSETNNNKS